ncbi:MAG: pyruvate formate lyase-activating protein [Chloroflexales bacterium]|nr:pyruvate formate lyase-activating protein [Chloroflexales bacterium]
MDPTGFIHSYTTASAHDGPGLRTVVWTTGCHFRCQYCHNPDTWHLRAGREVRASALVEELARYEPFVRATGGGVTLSGGEPLVQARFALSVLRGCKARGLHTALDTNGFFGDRLADEDLAAVDLVILDIKSWTPETHRLATGVEVEPVLRFARRLAALGRPAWVRFVLVPGLTDDQANLEGLAAFVADLANVERVELLPFHQLGRAKWAQLGLAYPLGDTPPPSPEGVIRAAAVFRARGLRVEV